jgi:teichoic acid transport system ATP-binding protein
MAEEIQVSGLAQLNQPETAEQIPEMVIRVEDVKVWFKSGSRDDFRSWVLDTIHGRRNTAKPVYALNGVSLTVSAGEVVGIIGANGAGKTTLCGVIARLLRPDEGSAQVIGNVSALLSMGTGFNTELTGRENIFLNGLMLGFSRKKITGLYDKIVAFAGLQKFIETPVKYYSSGMRSRLGFSIAAMLNPEILVLDEALGGGDAEFAERAGERIQQLVRTAKAVVVVTHNLRFVTEACDRALWIDKGLIFRQGNPAEVVKAYEESIPPRPVRRILTPDYEAPNTVIGEKLVTDVRNLSVSFTVNRKKLYALQNISFSVQAGEILGIIGPNGAGKTTLCRTLSRIYRPDSGTVQHSRKISALLSMGTGFNKNLDALSNIMLNGMMLGMSRKKMKRQTDRILEFAELTRHRSRPVKHFSNGMRSRLAFSIAVAVKPSLLLIDEALSTGDLSFKQKATEAMDKMIRKADAVIVVSHNLNFVKSVCTRAIWLNQGRLEFDGDPEEAVKRYQVWVDEQKQKLNHKRKEA